MTSVDRFSKNPLINIFMKTSPLWSELLQKIVMKDMAKINVDFRIFYIPPKNLHTHNIDNTRRCFCHIILLNILLNCCSNTYHWGLKLYYDLENSTELKEINWTLLLSHWAQVFVGSHAVLTLRVTNGRTFWNRCVINNFNK